MITGLTYASHQVGDLDRARSFYEGLLGLQSTGVYDNRWEEYALPDGTIFAVYKAQADTPDYFKKQTVTASIAFAVDDLDKLAQTLKKAGVTFLQEPVDNAGHCKMAYVADPDGNIVTLHELLEADD